ncbi:hypothetical protein [Rubrivirga sp.]|uniref:hypothetical protein n=1 Tax=Rubrivirga sp. TaxID=1885344 RepID=UPI003B52042A
MLHVALVGLLAGSLAVGTPDRDDDKKKNDTDSPRTAENATPGVFETARAAQDPQTITLDTYALGIPSDIAPIKLWASYAYGEAESIWDVNGEDGELSVAGTNGDIVSQRVNVGAQVNFISFPAFKLGGGALLTIAKNEFQAGSDPSPFTNGIGSIESDFGVQGIKVFGSARGRVVGVHGGYIFDLGSEREFGDQATIDGARFGGQLGANVPVSINPGAPEDQRVLPTVLVAGNAAYSPLLLPTALSNSDGRDAITFGADFDYPSSAFRVFGGIDYFMLQAGGVPEVDDDSDLLNFMLGAGIKLSVFEIGAAAQIQTRFDQPTVENIGTESGIGSHAGTIAPYIRISPPNLPASIYFKGAVQEEYTEFGYGLGGANSVKPSIGGTLGLSIGFN